MTPALRMRAPIEWAFAQVIRGFPSCCCFPPKIEERKQVILTWANKGDL